jgi:hypothetical protein
MVGNVSILRGRTYSAEGTGPRGSWEEGDQRRGKKNNLPHFWPEMPELGFGQLAWRRIGGSPEDPKIYVCIGCCTGTDEFTKKRQPYQKITPKNFLDPPHPTPNLSTVAGDLPPHDLRLLAIATRPALCCARRAIQWKCIFGEREID